MSLRFVEYVKRDIARRKLEGNAGSNKSRTDLIKNLERYEVDYGMKIRMSHINTKFVAKYEEWLTGRSYKYNTVGYFIRILRVLCNQAYNEGLLKEEVDFEDRSYTVKVGERHMTGYLTDEQLSILKSAELTPSLACAREIFLFCVKAYGMMPLTLVSLKKENFVGDRLVTKPNKGGGELSIRIEPSMMEFIEKYKADGESPFLLNFVDYHKVPEKGIVNAIHRIGGKYRTISKELGLPMSGTTARYTWLRKAVEMKVDTIAISEAMGIDINTLLVILKAIGISRDNRTELDYLNRFIAQGV